MFTRVKTPKEIENMRVSGKMLATVLDVLNKSMEQGVSAKELSDLAGREVKALGGKSAFLGYQGFPEHICISVNDEIVHGIPRSSTVIKDGDIVSLDYGVSYNNMITDSAISVICGNNKPEISKKKQIQNLLSHTEESLLAGLSVVKSGCFTGDIGYEVEKVLDRHGYGLIRDLVGHGVGHKVHEDPNIPNYGRKGSGVQLVAGMTIAVEPMATLGGEAISVDDDGWTIRTKDGSLAAHFEHTVLITDDGCEILTKL